jgi:precorrin-3B methylase
MTGEIERCQQAIAKTREGFDTCIVSTATRACMVWPDRF